MSRQPVRWIAEKIPFRQKEISAGISIALGLSPPWHVNSSENVEIPKMPVNVVSTPEEEIAWERAKARAHEEYPDATGDRFYRIVMAIYKKMVHYEPRTRQASSRRSR